jgi:hypothetical protein
MINFPPSPVDGQQYTNNGRSWRWSAAVGGVGVWQLIPVSSSDVDSAAASASAANTSAMAAGGSASTASSQAGIATTKAQDAAASAELSAASAELSAANAVALRNDLANTVDPLKNSQLVGHLSPSGITRKVGDVLREWEPKNTPSGALKFELVNDAAPLNYGGTRAIGVIQHKDTANGGLNEFIPGIVNQFVASGNGVVNAAAELSQTIWQGQFNYMRKTGDGSAHMYTAIGELGVYGPGGYSELGMYQGEMTNTGSALGTMSGVEMLLKDSPDGGTTTFSTKMQGVVSRIAKYNPTIRKSHSFYASCEGALPLTAIIGGNPGGLAAWERGFDFQGLNFTTGQFGLAPNNTFLGWLTAAGGSSSVLGVNATNNVFLAATVPSGSVNITNSGFASRLTVDDQSDAVAIYVGGALRRVGVGAVDSGGSGFRQLIVLN